MSELRPPEIRVFDTGGNYVRTIGRTGDGPGEFRALGNIGFLGDTLWTVDGNLKRVSFFSTEGRVLATVQQTPREPAAPTPRVFFSADVWAVLPRDMAVGLTSAAWSAQEGNQVPVIPILRMTRSGRTLDTIAWTSTLHTRMTFIPAPGRRLTVGQPFADTPLTVVATAAERVYIVDRTAAAAVRDASFRVVALGLTRFDGHPVKSEIVNE